MKFFGTYSFKWWQIGIFKLALLSIGVLIGSYWHEFWSNFTVALITVAVVASVYSLFVAIRQ